MHEVRVPKFGMSTIEVDVTEVCVRPGQPIAVGDPIAEIDTEKATMMIESDVAGTVQEVRVSAGNSYQVGDVVCVID